MPAVLYAVLLWIQELYELDGKPIFDYRGIEYGVLQPRPLGLTLSFYEGVPFIASEPFL